MRIISILTLVLLLLVTGCTTTEYVDYSNTTTLTIGAVLPLTGAASTLGEEVKEAMELAITEINANSDTQIRILYEDSQTNPTKAVSAYTSLAANKNPDVMLTMGSFAAVPAAPLAKQYEIPTIGIIALAPGVTENEYAFRFMTTSDIEVQPILAWTKELNLSSVGVLYMQDEYASSVVEAFEKDFTGTVHKSQFSMQSTNFKTELLNLVEKDVQAIFFVGLEPHNNQILTQVKELGINTTLLSTGTVAVPNTRALIDDLDMTVYISSPESYSSISKDWESTFIQTYAKEPSHFAAVGYDVLYLIMQASKEGNISAQLTNMQQFQGITGNAQITNREFNYPTSPATITADGEVVFK
jgi:branched-chain amino acid transport system substrate-binding protein